MEHIFRVLDSSVIYFSTVGGIFMFLHKKGQLFSLSNILLEGRKYDTVHVWVLNFALWLTKKDTNGLATFQPNVVASMTVVFASVLNLLSSL